MESPALGLSLLGLLAIALLLLTNAYFVAAEFALVAVRRTQIELWVQEGRRGATSAAAAIDARRPDSPGYFRGSRDRPRAGGSH